MEVYNGYKNWLIENGYTSWNAYINYIKTIDATLQEEEFEKIVSVSHLQQLFSKLEADISFSTRGKSDRSNLLSGFRNYIKYIAESQLSIRVWRIGSNWGDENVLAVFKEHQIAYAGKEVEYQVEKVKKGDIVAVTNKQAIVAVGKVTGLIDLNSFDATYADHYEDVEAITISPFYFKEDFPDIDFGIYDGQGKQFHEAHGNYAIDIKKLFNRLSNDNMYEKLKSLLKYKKQIILQGPPGTGKTRLAKEIAEQLVVPQKIKVEDILSLINVGDKIKSGKEYTAYVTKGFDEGKLLLVNESGNPFNINFSEIMNAFENRTWETETLTSGSKSASAGIAKFIFNQYLNRSDQFKLIQFHPSYSYEDFVRGITVENKGTQIDYVTKNKVLAQIASDALENYLDSQKESQTISKENWLNKEFELFIEEVEAVILKDKRFPLNDSVSVFDVEEDAFRYYGDNWDSKQRMKFKDLKVEYLADVKSRRDIKLLTNVSGRSKQHASYDFLMVEKLRSFLQKRPAFNPGLIEKEELKNYVLIIDEINRANLPSVLGELIYALEYRNESVNSMYDLDGDTSIILPPNLYIIGTMNTADRSVGHIDYAIRRRFAFVEILPEVLSANFETALFKKVSTLFVKDIQSPVLEPSEFLSSEFRPQDVWLGHSYFIKKENVESKIRLKYEILPILEEYIKDGVLRDSTEIRKIIANLEQEIQ